MPGEDRFSYMAFAYVGDTDEEALRIGQKIAWFLTVSNVPDKVAPTVPFVGALRAVIPRSGFEGVTTGEQRFN